jgi:hypothetical protein
MNYLFFTWITEHDLELAVHILSSIMNMCRILKIAIYDTEYIKIAVGFFPLFSFKKKV